MTACDVPLVPLYLIWSACDVPLVPLYLIKSVVGTTTQSHSLHSWYVNYVIARKVYEILTTLS